MSATRCSVCVTSQADKRKRIYSSGNARNSVTQVTIFTLGNCTSLAIPTTEENL